MSYQGTLVCKSTLPHFVDNGDGTVTDNLTGLMWEKKSAAGAGDGHDVLNTYNWSAASPYQKPDGTLFTTFLGTLNGGDYYNPTDMLDESAGAGTCFANHCDWRIPTIVELKSIVELSASGCVVSGSPCIDPAFGPTLASNYWSSSTVAGTTSYAWYVSFYEGFVSDYFKNVGYLARAVRSGR